MEKVCADNIVYHTDALCKQWLTKETPKMDGNKTVWISMKCVGVSGAWAAPLPRVESTKVAIQTIIHCNQSQSYIERTTWRIYT